MKGLLIFSLLFLESYSLREHSPFAATTSTEKHKGVCWVASRETVKEEQLKELVSHHVNWISQTPFGWQSKADSAGIRFVTNAAQNGRGVMWGESDEGLAATTQLAKRLQIKTLLKPHLWVRNSWPGEIEMKTNSDWSRWFADYEKFILHYAALAEKNKMEAFCLGTELTKTSLREEEWRTLIRKVRKVYHGKLTYAANFHQEYEQIKFWDALDFIGIQAYFSLTNNNNPNTTELVKGWNTHLQTIEKVANRFHKPVVFTELGYRSTLDAAVEPWLWPQQVKDKAVPSEEVQARCYEAFFQAVWNKSWMAGVYFWKWYPGGAHRMAEIDFTPQGKKAGMIIKNNFKN